MLQAQKQTDGLQTCCQNIIVSLLIIVTRLFDGTAPHTAAST